MKLAMKAYVVTLLLLTLAIGASAQKKNARPEKDPRNQAPTVGTGGSIGGPTGLFTVYDGSTLRKGEYTFSAAISNYDRDPGDVDITSVPLSFQVGITDHIELFFSTDAYRGIKVNSPRNLSGFYLPNSRVRIGAALTSAPAIVMSPRGTGTPQFQGAVFRPTGNQIFVQFPYVNGNAGTYGLLPPFFSGPVFGFAANTNALLGPPRTGGNGADNFPGIGSVYGSILPGVVLQTTTLFTANGAPAGEGPLVFTLAPSYLPDAPFINRTYGETSFNTFNAGAKIRFTRNSSPIGMGIVASYTWYADTGRDLAGFNQLQRGASGGGNNGDIALTFFADARLAKWANLSSNIGYNYTSKAKGEFPGGTYTMLDRPDELQSSIGVDFPVNKWFQPIAELRSTRYIGGRTPNAFENHPLDGIVGARIFFTRWAGIGFAYRHNFTQQDADSFKNDTNTATVVLPCVTTSTNCTPTTIRNTFTGKPQGFAESSDPHGYIGQLWIGRRDKRATEQVNQAPMVSAVNLSSTVITLGCPPGTRSRSGACTDNRTVNVATSASDPENDVLTYNYTVSGGRVVGSGANVQWDLSGVGEGTYTITAGVDDGCGVCGKTETRTVTVKRCDDCVQVCSCPSLTASGPYGLTAPGSTMSFSANLGGSERVSYNWVVSNGTIVSGQGTPNITVATSREMAGASVTATVSIGGLDPNCNCPNTASATGDVAPVRPPTLIDEYGKKKDDEVKAIVDAINVQLSNDPTARIVVVNYGTAAQVKAQKAQLLKGMRFRGTDLSRVSFVDGPNTGDGPRTKVWLVPAGAEQPGI